MFSLVDSTGVFFFWQDIEALFDYFQIVPVPLLFPFIFIKFFFFPDINLYNFYLQIVSFVFFYTIYQSLID